MAAGSDDRTPAVLTKDRPSELEAPVASDPLADFTKDDNNAEFLFVHMKAAALATPGDPALPGDAPQSASHPRRAHRTRYLVIAAAILVPGLIGYFGLPLLGTAGGQTGEISVDSQPPGAQVLVDGALKGVTPLALSLPEGEHVLEVALGDARRQRTVPITAGATASHFVEFSQAAVGAAPVGRLMVSSDRAGAVVRVDGVRRGLTPLTLNDVSPGEHRVAVGEGQSAIERVVTVAPNSLATVVASLGAVTPGAGWLSVNVPFEMQISEGQAVLGTTSASRTMLPAGRHTLRLSNPMLGFQTSVDVNIQPGSTASINVQVPMGTLSVNAVPWAEVLIDGRAVGPTPLGNLSLPIGTHEVLWRHPTYGERRQSVVVKPEAPGRVGVDFTAP